MEDFENIKQHVNILLVDDDLDYISVTAFFLKSKGYNVEIATSGIDALNRVKSGNIHIVLLDYYMPEMTGEDVVNKLREFNTEVIIILQTGFAGQQPPEETFTKLNIQNYHDKSDGVEKLLLDVMSAVRIFEQQNQMQLSKYRVSAVSKLIKGIAESLKTPIMSIGAGLEATKTLVEDLKSKETDNINKQIDKLYNNNKEYLLTIDKALSTVITQTQTENIETSLSAEEILNTFDLIILNEYMEKGVKFEKKIMFKSNSYIFGRVTDLIFIVCELLARTLEVEEKGKTVTLTIRENETAWYFSITSDSILKVERQYIDITKNILYRIDGIKMEEVANQFIIELKKPSN